LLSTLWYVLGNQEDAQDIAQEVFLRCWRTRRACPRCRTCGRGSSGSASTPPRTCNAVAWRRRVKPLVGAEIMPAAETAAPGGDIEDRESLERLRVALMHLRPEEKEVFLLRQNGELTYEQIAEVSHRPVGTVKTQMRSALQKLRKVLA